MMVKLLEFSCSWGGNSGEKNGYIIDPKILVSQNELNSICISPLEGAMTLNYPNLPPSPCELVLSLNLDQDCTLDCIELISSAKNVELYATSNSEMSSFCQEYIGTFRGSPHLEVNSNSPLFTVFMDFQEISSIQQSNSDQLKIKLKLLSLSCKQKGLELLQILVRSCKKNLKPSLSHQTIPENYVTNFNDSMYSSLSQMLKKVNTSSKDHLTSRTDGPRFDSSSQFSKSVDSFENYQQVYQA
eukprot:Sdes_comp24045_c0_seq1m22114